MFKTMGRLNKNNKIYYVNNEDLLYLYVLLILCNEGYLMLIQ